MKDTLECPSCQLDNAYFDGKLYTCPDCDYSWVTSGSKISKKSSSHELDLLSYKSLSKLKQPFFELKHGKLYDCTIDHRMGTENASIIPLAFAEGRNNQFVLIDARNYLKKYPDWLKEIIKMDFTEIWNDGTEPTNYRDKKPLTVLCATESDGNLIDYGGSIFYDFVETSEI